MTQTQSFLTLVVLVVLAFSPLVYLWARRRDAEPQPATRFPDTAPEGMLTARQAVAYHLYGQAVGWMPYAMADYDASPALQATWLVEANIALDKGLQR